jgi:hypothetical protein
LPLGLPEHASTSPSIAITIGRLERAASIIDLRLLDVWATLFARGEKSLPPTPMHPTRFATAGQWPAHYGADDGGLKATPFAMTFDTVRPE